MEEFKRVGSLVWRGLAAVIFVVLGITRLADVLLPSPRTEWIEFCSRHSILYSQLLVAQLATVGLSAWLVLTLADTARFEAAWPKIEFIGVMLASRHLTWGIYGAKYKLSVGRVVSDVPAGFNLWFWTTIFMLFLCIGMNPMIEFVFREKKVKEA